ncbi:dodecin family protein [Falsiroseomonas oryzae]|uniref:dodecin family protein n=1 Tax=Falsiroseomonas oryzae TaxID=2766473 RepID=UPI0022EB4172|nr:dodecin family protein [Roseomonas sp. MO-31]
MAVVKVIELLAESEQSWEDAARRAVEEATRTLRGVSSIYIKEFQATVENDRIKAFRVNAKISFLLDNS